MARRFLVCPVVRLLDFARAICRKMNRQALPLGSAGLVYLKVGACGAQFQAGVVAAAVPVLTATGVHEEPAALPNGAAGGVPRCTAGDGNGCCRRSAAFSRLGLCNPIIGC